MEYRTCKIEVHRSIASGKLPIYYCSIDIPSDDCIFFTGKWYDTQKAIDEAKSKIDKRLKVIDRQLLSYKD